VTVSFTVDGHEVTVDDDGSSLLEVLRDRLGLRSPKDGCSPQGQCGCCTVLVDGQPRVSCVTPARRVAGRTVTTVEGLDEGTRRSWGEAFAACGGSQCGFCTPGIVVRLEGLRRKGVAADDTSSIERALNAHLCRCTGWRTVVDSYAAFGADQRGTGQGRDPEAAARRARLEGHAPQIVGPEVPLGGGGFADDRSPLDALVAVPDGAGGWAVGESLHEARAASGKVQGRRTTVELRQPIELPPGEWDVTLQTAWVEPAYLETDASWCAPGGEPASPLANGGAFGGKVESTAPLAARELADRYGRAVRVLLSREDVVRTGPKRPPLAAGLRADGSGVVRVVATPGVEEAITAALPDAAVEQVVAPGPPTSLAVRGAGWAEAAVLAAGARRAVGRIVAPGGGMAEATVGPDGGLSVWVDAGSALDDTVLRSYCIGAAHMALSWVTSEGLTVDADGEVHDLTIRSFGIVRATEMPDVEVLVERTDRDPVNGSDAVFAAVAAAVWLHQGLPPRWPTGVALRR
jgi:xanthine dehydrogenase small subunit